MPKAVGYIQRKVHQEVAQNLEETEQSIRKIAAEGAEIIFLQELFNSEYFCWEENQEHFKLSEEIPGPTTDRFALLAEELGVVIFLPLFEKRAPGVYHNACAVIDADGTYLGKYRKKHIPDDPGFYEKYYFTPGDDDYKVFDTKHGKVGVLICWDQWFPEASRITSLKGAEILYYPTAIGWNPEDSDVIQKQEYEAWQTIQRAHAIANGVWVVSVNRVGTENGTQFWGGSFVSNPMGTIIHSSEMNENDTAVVQIDTSQTEHFRQVWPFLRDRRTDTYGPITKKLLDDE